jgi:erythromycin esterase
LRAYNADPSHTNKVHFEGFDVLTPHAVPALVAYLRKVDPEAVTDAEKALAPFVGVKADGTYPALPSDEHERSASYVSIGSGQNLCNPSLGHAVIDQRTAQP